MDSEKIIRDNIWFPFTCSQDVMDYPPLVIEHGNGMYVYDVNGKPYLDAIGSWWVSILGHNHPSITSSIKIQLDKLEHVLMAGSVATTTLELTDLLLQVLPHSLTRVFYSDNGSTAVEVALKMALQYWSIKCEKRTSFVALDGGYHGDTFGAMSVGGSSTFHSRFKMLNTENYLAHSPYCYRCPCNKQKESCAAECMDSLSDILQNHGSTIAACIFEPMVLGASGMRVYPAKVIKRIAELCRDHGILMIADEVAMGFGRTGKMFACEHADVVPDIMCIAKGLTGGYMPMAATITSESIYDVFKGGYSDNRTLQHGHTFTGNALASSAACATLRLLIDQKIPASLIYKIDYFTKKLMSLAPLEHVGDVRSIGLVGAIEIVENKQTKQVFSSTNRIAMRICQKAIEQGVLVRPLGNVIYFIPAYIITEQQIDEMINSVKTILEDQLYL